MAPSAHSIPSLLPWQAPSLVSTDSWRWQLEITSGGPQPLALALLHLYHHERTRRYEWLITSPKSVTVLARSRGPGWLYYDRAEAAMLLALTGVLRDIKHKPTSLPAREGAISAGCRGR